MPPALSRKIERLREMDAGEIAYRLRERCRLGLERTAHRLGAGGADDERLLGRLPRPATQGNGNGSAAGNFFLHYLHHAAARRFYLPAGEAEREKLAALVARRFPGWLPQAAAEADRLGRHRFELLGFGEVDLGPEIDWHRDPLTGAAWPRRFWADYDLVLEHPWGDPKRVHEINRHQHLPRLAKVYYLLGEERYAREAVRQLLGWIEQNPPGLGVNWHSSLEIALRVLSWTWTLFFLLGSEALEEGVARRIGGSLFAQLDHVDAYPSVYSSPNTHLLIEATALFVGGLLFGDCEGGRRWRRRGTELLVQEVDRQVLADGVHSELSVGYHCYAVEAYLLALVLARRNGAELPQRVGERVAAMLDFVAAVARPDGTLPLLGDDDGGRTLALADAHYAAAGELLATGAVLYGRGDWKGLAGGFREPALWLLGAEGWRRFQGLPASRPGELTVSFPEAGYFVQRSDWSEGAAHLTFDCGGLGEPGGGHGHADALSLTLFAAGRPLLVDPGTYVYNGQPAWRDAFRSTRAHNTVVVDGRDQSLAEDTFRWRRKATARRLDERRSRASGRVQLDYLAGEHDGYAPAVVHRRRLLCVRPGYWLVLDDFRGEGEHDFEVVYHLAPEARVSPAAPPAGREARLDVLSGPAGLSLFLHASAPLAVEIVEGAEGGSGRQDDTGAPPRGWVSRRYGERRPAPVVVARFRAAMPAAVITGLAPFTAGDARRAGAWRPRALPVTAPDGQGAALAIAVRHDDGEDLALLAPGGGEIEASPCRLRGEAFWGRFAGPAGSAAGGGRRLTDLLAVGTTRLDIDGTPLLAGADPITHLGPPPPPRAAAAPPTPEGADRCAESPES